MACNWRCFISLSSGQGLHDIDLTVVGEGITQIISVFYKSAVDENIDMLSQPALLIEEIASDARKALIGSIEDLCEGIPFCGRIL